MSIGEADGSFFFGLLIDFFFALLVVVSSCCTPCIAVGSIIPGCCPCPLSESRFVCVVGSSRVVVSVVIHSISSRAAYLCAFHAGAGVASDGCRRWRRLARCVLPSLLTVVQMGSSLVDPLSSAVVQSSSSRVCSACCSTMLGWILFVAPVWSADTLKCRCCSSRRVVPVTVTAALPSRCACCSSSRTVPLCGRMMIVYTSVCARAEVLTKNKGCAASFASVSIVVHSSTVAFSSKMISSPAGVALISSSPRVLLQTV